MHLVVEFRWTRVWRSRRIQLTRPSSVLNRLNVNLFAAGRGVWISQPKSCDLSRCRWIFGRNLWIDVAVVLQEPGETHSRRLLPTSKGPAEYLLSLGKAPIQLQARSCSRYLFWRHLNEAPHLWTWFGCHGVKTAHWNRVVTRTVGMYLWVESWDLCV